MSTALRRLSMFSGAALLLSAGMVLAAAVIIFGMAQVVAVFAGELWEDIQKETY